MLAIFYLGMVISACWLLGGTLGGALHPLAGICLIADCIMAVSVAQHTNWWLGFLALAGGALILLTLAAAFSTIGRAIVWEWEIWMIDHHHLRDRRKYEQTESCK